MSDETKDITERLRSMFLSTSTEAADEIERLRRENAELYDCLANLDSELEQSFDAGILSEYATRLTTVRRVKESLTKYAQSLRDREGS